MDAFAGFLLRADRIDAVELRFWEADGLFLFFFQSDTSLVADGFPSFPGILVVPLANSIPSRRAENQNRSRSPLRYFRISVRR